MAAGADNGAVCLHKVACHARMKNGRFRREERGGESADPWLSNFSRGIRKLASK